MSTSSASNKFSQTNIPRPLASLSHLVLQHPLEELQDLQYEENGSMYSLADANEQIIWTNGDVHYVVTYHKGTSKHSIWRLIHLHSEEDFTLNGAKVVQLYPLEHTNNFSMRRVWQDESARRVAEQVLLATGDSMPILCFLMKESQELVAFSLCSNEESNCNTVTTWTIHAVAAVPVVATRPWLRQSGKQFDLITLSADGNLFLYRGKHQLCQLKFPWSTLNMMEQQTNDRKKECIVALGDPVQGRLNVITSSGQVYRCSMNHHPASALVASCMMALEEGLESSLHLKLLSSLWSHSCLQEKNISEWGDGLGVDVDVEWVFFVDLLTKWCRGSSVPQEKQPMPSSSWEFLLRSNIHSKNKGAFARLTAPLLRYEEVHEAEAHQGYDHIQYKDILTQILIILHAVYEDYKLNTLHWRDLEALASLLGRIALALHEWNYLDHYARDFPGLFGFFKGLRSPISWKSLKLPFNVFCCLEDIIRTGRPINFDNTLPSFYRNKDCACVNLTRKVLSFYELLTCKGEVARVLPSGLHVEIAHGSFSTPEQRLVLAMVGENFSLADLDRLPAGVSLLLRHASNSCREAPPSDWCKAAYVLVGREDLALMFTQKQTESKPTYLAAPYMLHLQPVPSITCETLTYENATTENVSAVDKAIDGMEHMFNGTIQLRFGCDLRLNEVRRLLCSSKPVAVRMANPPDVTDPDMVAQQQAQLWQLAQRTTSLPFGRGAFTLATMRTLLTEVLSIPKLVLAGCLPSQHDAMVNLDPSTGNLSDLTSWPEFHNGVAAGLRLAPCQDKITRTWIVYNRPEEPSFSHAGLLMSLGLQGHLRVLAATDVYRYLSQEHEATTVGILLGMAAAYRGTMDSAISKILYLHIPARHPPSFPELELPTLMQSAALMAVGLLYQGSAHRLTTEILLAEIGRKPGCDNVLEREGYALAAGLALGLVTLGKGKSAWGLADMSIEGRLLHYMSGGTEPGEGRHLTHDAASGNAFSSISRGSDDLYQNNGQVMEGSIVNLDVTAPGATLALGLMFLKTNCEEVAARLATPDTHFALEYVRPDFILIRVVARNLVLWDSVQATENWVQTQIPAIVKEYIGSSLKEKEGSDTYSGEVDMEALAQAHVNILAGVCLSIGLRYAGTCSSEAQQLLHHYALYFLKEKRSAALVGGTVGPDGKCSYVDRGTLETCLNVAVLSLSVVMAGSGHIGTLKLLRYLRRRGDTSGAISYGNHMAINMALGFLFLGGGTTTFATSNSAIAALLIALYPRFPTAPNDHRCHLQAFRHLYVLATEARYIETIDVDTGLPVYVPLEVTLRETASHAETTFCQVTPCLLPERYMLKRVQVCGPRYWPQDIRLTPCDLPWWESNDLSNPFCKGILLVKRKVGARSYDDDPIGSRSLLSRTFEKTLKAVKVSPAVNENLKVDEIVSTFSADPSLRAFAHMICTNSGSQFEEFCLQALLECVGADKPALLQAYLSFYTVVEEMIREVRGQPVCSTSLPYRSLYLCSLKISLAYTEAIGTHSLELQGEPILQRTFIAALAIQVDDLLKPQSPPDHGVISDASRHVTDLCNYFHSFQNDYSWICPTDPFTLAYYLQWYNVPCPSVISEGLQQLGSLFTLFSTKTDPSPSMPLLALVLPGTKAKALVQINQLLGC
ncbi:hypothetical protein KP509_30G071400 [Ceratopteris richardii]|nr:hypothetical protein KP509_30G071400 [Ceratopteris richardii]